MLILSGVSRELLDHTQTGLRYKNESMQGPTDQYEIRMFDAGEKTDFRTLLEKARKPVQPRLTFGAEFTQVIHAVEAQQRPSGGTILPKDHSLHIESIDMSLGDDASQRYFEQLSEIGKVEGFHMVGMVANGDTSRVENRFLEQGYDNFSLIQADHRSTWVEDYSEPMSDGSCWLPARVDPTSNLISQAQTEGRVSRLKPLGLPTSFPKQGGVNLGDHQCVGAAEGLAQGKSVRQGQSYLEGGNLMPGTRADGTPFVVVGKDSIAITQELLSQEQGKPLTMAETLEFIGKELGCPEVVPVEQPGDFHIDMRMMPVGPGEFVVQDSREAARLQEAWLREKATPEELKDLEPDLQKMRESADYVAPLEDQTCKDLESAGMKVHRLAGVFRDLENNRGRDGANFFNARHGTNAKGQHFSILMGGTAQEEAYIAKALLQDQQAPIDHLYFLDPTPNRDTLRLQGGMKCRTKPHGERVAAPAPTAAAAPTEPNLTLF